MHETNVVTGYEIGFCNCNVFQRGLYEGHLEGKERFAIKNIY
jgi:hypothetical protein